MRLRTLLDTQALGLRLLGGEEELDRPVRGVMTTDLRDPSRYLSGGELVLTGLAWRRGPQDSEPFVRRVAGAGIAALAAGEAEVGGVPADLVAACALHRLPLFAVDERVAFAAITEHVVRRVSTGRAGDLAVVVDRHRRLLASGPGGGGPDAVLDLLASDLDLRGWVLSATGRRIAGDAAGLPAALRGPLAGEELAARAAGRPAPHRAVLDDRVFALLPVAGGDGDDAPALPLSDWLLAVETDPSDWPPGRLDLLHGVTRLLAAARERQDTPAAVRRRLADEVLEAVRTGAPVGEAEARLRMIWPEGAGTERTGTEGAGAEGAGAEGGSGAAGTAAGAGGESGAGAEADGAGSGAAITVTTGAEGAAAEASRTAPGVADGKARDGNAPDGGMAGGRHAPGGADVPRRQVVVARLEFADGAGASREALRTLLEEALAGCRGLTGPAAVACDGAEAVALLSPAPGRPGAVAGELAATVGGPLERGLAGAGRLTVGVSAAVASADGLRGALEEARHARAVAAARPGTVCVAGHDELASHVLLLPFVPDDVRRAFTARLLDPLAVYDRRHRAELIPTLEAFLECDGSWTRCAARLHLHVNTLRYRVGRIEELTGRQLSRLEDKTDFFLALRMR